ncbi:MAG: hypothetical protein ACK5P7_01905 [Bdellovibrio sp.]
MKPLSRFVLSVVISFLVPTTLFATDSNWNLLVAKIIELGSVTQYENGELRSLQILTPPDLDQSRRAEYISTIGFVGPDNVYHAQAVSAVEEDWRLLANGDWEIEQWIFYLRTNGEFYRVLHQTLQRTQAGMITDVTSHSKDFQSPEVQKRWLSTLQSWYDRSLNEGATFK